MRRLLVLLLLVVSVPAWATKYPLSVKDCRGKTVTIPREPRRIISLAPSNTEILFALGLEKKIVGVTNWCDYPAAAKKKPKVGDRTTNMEKVLTLKPDLVLAHGTVNDTAIRALEKHGMRVVAVDPKTIDEVLRDIKLIGRITNREKAAAKVAGEITKARNDVKKRVAKVKTKPRVLVAIQMEPLWVAGPSTFVDEMIRLAGGVNVAADSRPGFAQFSTEAAILAKPTVIISTDKGGARFFRSGIWKNSKAQVCETSPDALVRPGPRLAEGIRAVAKLLHPKLFK
ncbi:MAG: ABC transporter substrate-binding protein [Armatimonadota bacterium]